MCRTRKVNGMSESTPPVIHIGPPKTASTTIQSAIIPQLGRPYAIKTPWTSALAEGRIENIPALPDNIVVSDERLGQFRDLAPAEIARSLAQVFPHARIIHIARETVDLFYSFYRQSLINNVAIAMRPAGKAKLIYPATADGFFEASSHQFARSGCGFIAMIRNADIAEAFQRRFDFQSLPFEMLMSEPRRFARTFAHLCGCDLEVDLPSQNASDVGAFETYLKQAADRMPSDLINVYRDYYESSLLSWNNQEKLMKLASST
jgi:hypothetical protein